MKAPQMYLAVVGGVLVIGSLTANLLHPNTYAPTPSALAPPSMVDTRSALPPDQEARLKGSAESIASRLSLSESLRWQYYTGRSKDLVDGKQTLIADGLDSDGNYQVRIIFDHSTEEVLRISCSLMEKMGTVEPSISPAARRDAALGWLHQVGPQEAGKWRFVGFGSGNGPIYSTHWHSGFGDAYISSDSRTGRLVTARFTPAPTKRVASL